MSDTDFRNMLYPETEVPFAARGAFAGACFPLTRSLIHVCEFNMHSNNLRSTAPPPSSFTAQPCLRVRSDLVFQCRSLQIEHGQLLLSQQAGG